MTKFDEEREILKLSLPLLKKIYGEFIIDETQKDCPDASIILEQNKIKIGIEITSTDKEDVSQYFNDKKLSDEIHNEQLHNLVKNKEYSKNPIKKLSISYPHDYIYEGVIKKEKKYIEYEKSDSYKEIIILAFSKYLKFIKVNSENYFKLWTQYLLKEKNFPFDKVIYVCKETQKSIIVYDKTLKIQNKIPKINSDIELGSTFIKSGILPFNTVINMKEIFKNNPSVPKESKKNIKNRNKENRKKIKNSRKANRPK